MSNTTMHWYVTVLFVGALLFFVGYRIGYRHGHRPGSADQTRPPRVDIIDEDIKTELRAGRKIEAIKLYRQRSGADLKDAKTAVEAMDAGMGHVRTAE